MHVSWFPKLLALPGDRTCLLVLTQQKSTKASTYILGRMMACNLPQELLIIIKHCLHFFKNLRVRGRVGEEVHNRCSALNVPCVSCTVVSKLSSSISYNVELQVVGDVRQCDSVCDSLQFPADLRHYRKSRHNPPRCWQRGSVVFLTIPSFFEGNQNSLPSLVYFLDIFFWCNPVHISSLCHGRRFYFVTKSLPIEHLVASPISLLPSDGNVVLYSFPLLCLDK